MQRSYMKLTASEIWFTERHATANRLKGDVLDSRLR